MGTPASVLPGPSHCQRPQLPRPEGNLARAGATATGDRWALSCGHAPRPTPTPPPLPGLLLQAVQGVPWEVIPPTLHAVSLSPLPPAELFLNSLSQPFSLEEQEQILSCLSIDSLSLSDDSEKVSGRPTDRAACWPTQRP
jgi:hypothetical protein